MQLFDIETNWMPWIETGLLALALCISAIQPKAIVISLQAVITPIQRRYTLGSNQPALFLLRGLFQLGTASLALLIATQAYTGNLSTPSLQQYLLTTALLLGVILLKWGLEKWMYFAFRFAIHEQTYHTYRSDLWQGMSICLWGILLFSPWMNATCQWLLPAIILGCYYGIIGWKIMLTVGWSISHLCYTLLYLAHVEVLPIVVMIAGIRQLIN